MEKRMTSPLSGKKLLMMMVFVILLGLSMGVVGILSVSKQRRTREEALRERLVRGLTQIRVESENRIGGMIEKVFSFPVAWANIESPGYVRMLLKRILRENPVVQYPFLVGENNRFIFPPVPDSAPAVYSFKLVDLLSSPFHPMFDRGMVEEFENRDYGAAIAIYLDILKGAGLDRDRIIDTVWGDAYFPSPRTVDNFILKLRQKIENDPKNPRHLITLHGSGYKLKLSQS